MIGEYVLARIEALEQELESLRKVGAYDVDDSGRKTKLKGLWKGIDVTEEDIEEAKRALFRDAYEFETQG